jgi:hypothetical protein
MSERPEQFICDACLQRLPCHMWCVETADAVTLLCLRCCPCPSHLNDDPGGTVVFPWRGLHHSEARTRRHQ